VRVFADPGLSAANGGPRPQFDALREQIRAGHVAQLWTVEQTRLERTEVGWFALAAELDAAGIEEVHTNRDGIVRVVDEVAGIKAVIAAAEVRKLKRRVHDKLDGNAAAGIPPPTCPYGFRRVVVDGVKTYAHDPEQAAVVCEVADRVLAGWSLTNVARDLARRGVTGSRGGALTSTSIKDMVTTPAVAGLRLHQGAVVGAGNWSGILDEATWKAVCAKLGAARVVNGLAGAYPVPAPGRRSARRHLLTGGLSVCGVCGARMVGTLRPTARDGSKVPYYVCGVKYGGRGCVGIMAGPAERHVLAVLMAALANPQFLAQFTSDDHAEQRDQINVDLAEIERRRTALAGAWGRRDLTDDEWRTARDSLAADDARLRGELAEVPQPVGDVDPAVLTDARVVSAMDLGERREFVGMFVKQVVVHRAKPPYDGTVDNRIAIEWRGR
jgi:DNA invertase Pin-like site-specific DNA recombinase